jgi:hypothetical protein
MSQQTIQLRAALDQARAALRDRIAEATVAIGTEASREADSCLADFFGPLLARALEGEDLAGSIDSGMTEFLLAAGVCMWAEIEADRIEEQPEPQEGPSLENR